MDRDKRGIDPEPSIVSIVVKCSDVSRENKRYQVWRLKVQVKQPVIGSALFLGRLNRSDGSVMSKIKFRDRFDFLLRHSSQ